MTISERIFQIMDRNKLSQLEFSRRTGIAQSTISDWKRKKTNPAADKIMVICDVLQISPYELLSGTQDSNYKTLDYIIVDKKSDEYMVIANYQRMDEASKSRLLGYMQALNEK